jgi:hypothetical protein
MLEDPQLTTRTFTPDIPSLWYYNATLRGGSGDPPRKG